MNDLPGVLTALALVIAAVGGVLATVLGYRNRQSIERAKAMAVTAAEAALESKAEIIATKDGVFELGKRVDGRLSQILELTEASALAKGRLEGTATEKARVADIATSAPPRVHKRNGDHD